RKRIEMLCLDLHGQEQWCQSEWVGMLALPGDRFIVNTREGRPLLIDDCAQILHRSEFSGVAQAVRHCAILLFPNKDAVFATNLEFRKLWRFVWPGNSSPMANCFSNGAFYWIQENSLLRCAVLGQPEIVCRLPSYLAAEAMDEYERKTGRSALV